MGSTRADDAVSPAAPPREASNPVVARRQRWEAEVLAPAIAKNPERRERFSTLGGI